MELAGNINWISVTWVVVHTAHADGRAWFVSVRNVRVVEHRQFVELAVSADRYTVSVVTWELVTVHTVSQ